MKTLFLKLILCIGVNDLYKLAKILKLFIGIKFTMSVEKLIIDLICS